MSATGQVVLVFADAPGSEEEPEGFLGEARREVAVHGGRLLKTRSAWFMAAFGGAEAAVRAMLAVQEGQAGRGAPLLRAGVHLGTPIRVDGGDGTDYFGPDVNRAARILAAAHPGQVLLSQAARDEAGDGTPAEWRDLGEHRLRDIERPEHLWLALPAALRGRAFPPLEAPSARRTNLPPATSAFLGRAKELERFEERLRPGGARLLTLTGTGGVGKSRLAVRAAAAAIERFPGGVWFADLTAATDAAGICGAVAGALGMPIVGAADPASAVADLLALRKPLLLVLDNFEHLLRHAAATAGLWAGRAPRLCVLATSRAPLGLDGEEVLDLLPLEAPPLGARFDVPSDLLRYDAAQLFVDRASIVRRGFAVTAENAGEIAELCARLDGIPLAIELAAARAAVLRPAEIVARLDRKFDLLRSSQRDLTPRQRTLTGAIEWSFDLLTDGEKEAFLQACIFRGGFTVEAAEGVLDLPGGAPSVRAAIRGLREKSLLREVQGPAGKRFSMYVAIHEYAWHRWRWTADEPRQRALERRHAAHFAAMSERLWFRARRDGVGEPVETLDGEAENLGAAHDASLAMGDGELAARLALGIDERLNRRGPTDERLRRLEATLAAPPGGRPDLRAILLAIVSPARAQAGRADPGDERFQDDAVALARSAGNDEALAFTLVQRASARSNDARFREVFRDLDEAEAISRRLADDLGLASAFNVRGITLRVGGRLAEADSAYGAAEELYRRLGNLPGAVLCVAHRVQTLLDRGQYDEALRHCTAGFSLAQAAGASRIAANLRTMEAVTLADAGRPSEALAVLSEADELVRSVGDRRLLARTLDRRGEILTMLGDPHSALPLLEQAIALRKATGDLRGATVSLARRGEAHSVAGNHAEALADLAAASAAFEAAGDRYSHGTAELHAAIAERRAGRPADALKRLAKSATLLEVEGGEVNQPELQGERARSLAALGRGREALAAADLAVGAATRLGLGTSRRMMFAKAIVAVAARAAGDEGRRSAAADEALALARSSGLGDEVFVDDLHDALYPRKS